MNLVCAQLTERGQQGYLWLCLQLKQSAGSVMFVCLLCHMKWSIGMMGLLRVGLKLTTTPCRVQWAPLVISGGGGGSPPPGHK